MSSKTSRTARLPSTSRSPRGNPGFTDSASITGSRFFFFRLDFDMKTKVYRSRQANSRISFHLHEHAILTSIAYRLAGSARRKEMINSCEHSPVLTGGLIPDEWIMPTVFFRIHGNSLTSTSVCNFPIHLESLRDFLHRKHLLYRVL